jgi:transglutaminase-like putative cysteine protease
VSGRRAHPAWWPAARPVLAFCALALLAGVRFATLLTHPPLLRVLGVVAAAGAAGLALSYTRSLPRHRGLSALLRLLIAALGAYLALRASGVPARLLWPSRWGALLRELGHGLDALNGLWPYRGTVGEARMAVLFALPLAIVPAAMLAFWPTGRRARARRALATALLLVLYLAAATNQSQVGWQFQGVLLLALLCLWAWAWRPRAYDRGRVAAWLVAMTAVALVGAGVLQSRTPLLDYRSWNPFGPAYSPTAFSWNQAYGPLPWSSSTETMVSVDSTAPHLWRATTLDRFDGVGFVRSAEQPRSTAGLEGVALHPGWVTHATFTVRGLSSDQLLSPGEIIGAGIRGEDTPRLGAVAADGTLASSAVLPSGNRYMVTAYAPEPSAAEMRRAPSSFPAAYAPYTELDLPADGSAAPVSPRDAAGLARIQASPYARAYALARSLAAGEPDDYDVVARTEAFFARGFTYDQQPRPSTYPLIAFLFGERSGYCQQFSGAMTLLLRMDGIPSRVAAGFLSGSRDGAAGVYDVTAQDAHEWVEVFFEGVGWVPFNPTPASRLGNGSGSSSTTLEGSAAVLRHRSLPARSRAHRGAKATPLSSSAGLGASPSLALVLAGGTLALALGAAWLASATRVQRRFAGDANGAVLELSRALLRVGRPLAPRTTLAELERELDRSHGAAAARYVRLLRELRYGPRAGRRAPWARERRAARTALCRRRGPLTRLRVLIALPPAFHLHGPRSARR